MLLGGVVTLIAILLVFPYVGQFAFSHYAPRHLGGVFVNPDGIRYLLFGLALLSPAWLLGRVFAPRRSMIGWFVVALSLMLIVLAGIMFYFFTPASLVWRWGNVVLLSSYALAPFVCTVELILLLDLVARHSLLIPHGPRRRWIRMSEWISGGVLLMNNLASLPIDLARILQEMGLMTQPSATSYLPDSWNAILRPMFTFGAYATRPALYFSAFLLACYSVGLYRRMRVLDGSSGC
jgi:hypothetical protein